MFVCSYLVVNVIEKKILNELNAGVYDFNLSGSQDLYLNKFLQAPITHLNKVYKVPYQQMLKRTIHPDDIALVLSGYDFVTENPDSVHDQLRRAQVHAESDYYWFINFLGLEETEEGTPKRVHGVQFQINPSVKPTKEHIAIIRQGGVILVEM